MQVAAQLEAGVSLQQQQQLGGELANDRHSLGVALADWLAVPWNLLSFVVCSLRCCDQQPAAGAVTSLALLYWQVLNCC